MCCGRAGLRRGSARVRKTGRPRIRGAEPATRLCPGSAGSPGRSLRLWKVPCPRFAPGPGPHRNRAWSGRRGARTARPRSPRGEGRESVGVEVEVEVENFPARLLRLGLRLGSGSTCLLESGDGASKLSCRISRGSVGPNPAKETMSTAVSWHGSLGLGGRGAAKPVRTCWDPGS